MENVVENLKNKMLDNIKNMTTKKLCERINAYAVATKYSNDGDIVCKIQDTLRASVKIVLIDSEYFGTEDDFITIDDPIDNDFKDLFIRDVLSRWNNLSTDEKMDYINTFID